MPWTCFSYSPDVLPEAGNLGVAQPSLDLRRMPTSICFTNTTCFRCPADATANATQPDSAATVRRMPTSTCFRY